VIERRTDPRTFSPSLRLLSEQKRRRVGDVRFLVTESAQPVALVQKCDAERPCSPCILAERTSVCVYDQENPQSACTRSSHGADDRRSGQHFVGAVPLKIPTIVSIDSPADSELSSTASTSDVTLAVAHEPTLLRTFEVDRVQHGHSSGLALVRRNSLEQDIPWDSNPSISIFSSFLPSTIPPEPWIRLSFLGGERLQVQFSEKDVTDLDMRSYVPEREAIDHKLTHILVSAGCGFFLGLSS